MAVPEAASRPLAGDEEGPTRRQVTQASLAAEAGVSLSTVSKVLNGRADVAADTRQRVERLLETHGYRRPGSGRTASGLVELVFHEFTDVWSMEVIQGVQDVAQEQGLSVVLTRSGDRHAPGPEWLPGVLARRPAGVVLVFSELPLVVHERLQLRSIPVAVIDPAGDPAPGVPSVGSTNWAGGLSATRHLIELGHRRIAAVTGPRDMMCSLARVDGYRSAMTSAGLPVREEWVRFGDFHIGGGLREALVLLSGEDRPTAVFAGSDLQAVGVLDAARRLGLRVPEDLSVVGYDDVALARWSSPQLTTVHQPLRKMASAATRMVLALAAGEPVDQKRLDLATHLVVRGSTAAPAG